MTRTGILILARSARKSSWQAVTQLRVAWADAEMATWKLFCQGLVADPAAVQEIDVVGAVREVFHRGWPVSGDTRREAVEDAAVDAVGAVVGLGQERQQRRHQHGCPDPPRAVNGQVAGHFTGSHGESGQYHSAQVERAEQDMKAGG
jgi:hypothetical protein